MKRIIFSLRSVCCYIIAALLFVILSPTLSSCSKDDDTLAYITKEQLYGIWRCEQETYQSSYEFYPDCGAKHSSTTTTLSGPYTSTEEGVFYLHRADEHILGLFFHAGNVVANGKEKATYISFEWLNNSHTRFSLDNWTYIKQ